jgi:hypothetical protein
MWIERGASPALQPTMISAATAINAARPIDKMSHGGWLWK